MEEKPTIIHLFTLPRKLQLQWSQTEDCYDHRTASGGEGQQDYYT